MKKLKDIIYDYNDVFVALLLVAIAAGVIFWRINVVMAYPKYAANYEEKQNPEIDINFNDVNLEQEAVENMIDPEDEPETTPENPQGQQLTSDPAVNPPVTSPPGTDTPPITPKPKDEVKTFRLTISKENKNGNWNAVGDALEKAGIVESKSKFVNRVVERKVDGKLQLGEFSFSSDMSLDEVIDTLID